MKVFRIYLLLFFAPVACLAQSIPAVKAKALDSSEVTLPNPESQQALVLVVGFSHKSGELCKVWGKKLAADYGANARVGYYVLPIVQSAPSFVRPMILRGMRKDTPAQELPHYVPLVTDESEWKKLVNITAPDDAYLIVAAPDGHPVWQAHGPYADDVYTQLKKSVSALLDGFTGFPNTR